MNLHKEMCLFSHLISYLCSHAYFIHVQVELNFKKSPSNLPLLTLQLPLHSPPNHPSTKGPYPLDQFAVSVEILNMFNTGSRQSIMKSPVESADPGPIVTQIQQKLSYGYRSSRPIPTRRFCDYVVCIFERSPFALE